MGATKKLSRSEAIEQYIILRLRTEDLNRLDFLVNGLSDGRVVLQDGSLFSAKDLKDTARTAFIGWLASLTERDQRTVYAFDCLFVLFPERQMQIIKAQVSLEGIHDVLQQFRNTVAFHARSVISAHIAARINFKDEDTYLDFVSAIHDFQNLMSTLRAEELTVIPELPTVLKGLGVHMHPAFMP